MPKQRGPFLVCVRSGRIVRLCTTGAWKWLLPVTGLLALIWYLVRVLPKPARATYPCQRVAAPLASAFIGYLAALPVAVLGLQAWRRYVRQARTVPAWFCAGVAAIATLFALHAYPDNAAAYAPVDPANQPIGEGKGIFPGRVVWVRDPSATPWDGVNGKWWEDASIDQTRVDDMLGRALRSLTGSASDTNAWDKAFRQFNTTRGRGNIGYTTQETVVVKINLNNSSSQSDADNQADASKQTVLALLRQLVHQAGIAENRITICDPSRLIPDRIYTPCHTEFPGVTWVDPWGGLGRTSNVWVKSAFNYSKPNGCGTNIARCIQQATYMINMPLLKGHEYSGVTLSAKNHYGSVDGRDHSTLLRVWETNAPQYSMLVDLFGARELDGKTMLFLTDGLFGNICNTIDNNRTNCAFNNLFAGEWSSSLFASFDPVAIDSVCLDFLYAEFGTRLGRNSASDTRTPSIHCDNYLHEAAQAVLPPSGTTYQPDGTRLQSLGVHEHWNSPVTKQYSRNLGGTNGIELVAIQIPEVALDSWRAFDDAAWHQNPGLFNGEGLEPAPYQYTTNGPWNRAGGSLVSSTNGQVLPVSVSFSGVTAGMTARNLTLPAGSDAADVFGGHIGTNNAANWSSGSVIMTLSGLEPTRLYNLALWATRGGDTPQYSNRFTDIVISSADAFQNTSSAGTPLLTNAAPADGVRMRAAWVGRIARYSNIQPGTDGMIRVTLTAGADMVNTNGPYATNGYLNAFMLEAQPARTFVDSDTDGMDDRWEIQYFGSTGATNAAPDGDADGDGFSNYGEFRAGTDPLSSVSRLEIAGIIPPAGATNPLVLQWGGVTGKTYSILQATNLPGSWTVVRSNITGASGNVFTGSTAGIEGFWRIKVE